MRPELHEYHRGDFLIRNLFGADPGYIGQVDKHLTDLLAAPA